VRSSRNEPRTWDEALAGDSDAFVAIFDLHHDRVYRHALRMTANGHDAEDITAGAFLELWRRRRSVRLVDDSVLPWLLVTATNLARNLARGLRRYRALINALPRAETTNSAADIAVKRIEEERIDEQLRRALNTLSKSDAAILALTMFEQYSPAEAAVALGISDGAARTRLHRARTHLAAALGTSLAGERDTTTRRSLDEHA
jgi:RNA polymerase sigma factor (sigma-70 family)